MDNVYTLNCARQIEGGHTFFLDVQKAYDTVVGWFVVKIVGHRCEGEEVACNYMKCSIFRGR